MLPPPPATPRTPAEPTVQPSTPTPTPASTSPAEQKPPMSPQVKGAITLGVGFVGTLIGPAIAKGMFGSFTPPPLPI